jgi:hypothetical protein
LDIQGLAGLGVPETGEYAIYTWLGDAAGNVDPSTAVSTTLRLDALPPLSVAHAPARTDTAPIQVTWVATDAHSGLESVSLWVKKGDSGTWMDTGLTDQIAAVAPGPTAQGFFLFQPTGKSSYYFGVQARDRAGNAEEQPAGNGDVGTECETWQRLYLPVLWKAGPSTSSEFRP